MKSAAQALPPLPGQRSAQDVYADFLRYLLNCAGTYIKETHSASLWDSVKSNIDFVLSQPNGREGSQQKMLRKAAALGGLISDDQAGDSRLQFVTEGEASLNFCINQGLTTPEMQASLARLDGVFVRS